MNHPDILIPRKAEFENKLARFRRANMRVVADFDGTITHPRPSSWALLDQIEHMMPGYTQSARDLYRQYHPFEVDQTLSRDHKNQIMKEWWMKALELFRKFWLKEAYFKAISIDTVWVREGMHEAFDYFLEHSIPVLILSAWVYQTIDMVLKKHRFEWNHISLSANKVIFDEAGNYESVLPEGYIHAGNKSEHTASHEMQEEFQWRSHIILLGDNIHDIEMIAPYERDDTIAVGYYQEWEQKDRKTYSDIFDIVVTSDTSDLGVLRYLLWVIR